MAILPLKFVFVKWLKCLCAKMYRNQIKTIRRLNVKYQIEVQKRQV